MSNDEQRRIWNDVVGSAWVDHADAYDNVLEPTGLAAMDLLGLRAGERVIDVGCGTGQTTCELARRVEDGPVVGVDLSDTMLDAARRRAARDGTGTISFRTVDVQEGDLGPDRFDAAFSRMGVMFFSDPVKAFTNIASSLHPGGRFAFSCFKDVGTNPFMLLPIVSVADILTLPPTDPSGPNPFSLADPDATRAMLTAAGFVDIDLHDGPAKMTFAITDSVEALAHSVLEQTPMAGPSYREADETTKAAARRAVSDVFESSRTGDRVSMDAGIWLVSAHRPA